jgi:lysophospholipase L1-like esterase
LKIIADGDSIFEGTGAVVGGSNSSGTNVYSMMGVLSYMLDLDLYDAAVGGSGFITLGNGGQPTMVNRFDAYIAPYPCDIFISGGGLNDGYTTYSQTVEDAVNAYFVKVDALYRKTKTRVVIVSPYEPNGATKAQHLGILGIRDREKVLCLQYGFVFIDMIDGKSFDEMGNLVQDSSTTLGGITDNGRSTIFYFDGTHPNEAGHQYAGKRIMTELYRLLR